MISSYSMFLNKCSLASRILLITELAQKGLGVPWVANITYRNYSQVSLKANVSLMNTSSTNRTSVHYVQCNVIGFPGYQTTPVKCLSTNSVYMKTFKSDAEPGKESGKFGKNHVPTPKKYKEDTSPQILLIESEGKMINITLKQAERMAKRRDLKIVQVEDPTLKGKTNKLVYKLITGKEYYEVSKAKKEAKITPTIKGEKTLTVTGKIAEHDLTAKLHNIEKWLKKGFQIKVTIASRGSSPEDLENVYSKMEEEVTRINGRILQRREKFGDIKFFVAPPKEEKHPEKNLDDRTGDASENTDSLIKKEKPDES